MADNPSTRTAVKGSCHCGTAKYIVFLTLPHPHPPSGNETPANGIQRFYRCNCTICHKSGYFHVRVADDTDDFLLLSPTDPVKELGGYSCNRQVARFFFCKTCSTSCFVFMGDSEVVEVDLADLGVSGGEQDAGQKTKAWRVKRGGGHPEFGNYLSVNGHTIDAGQGFDMRELKENKAVQYYNALDDDLQVCEKPQKGGCH